ncbi:transcriptional regulator [Lactobacillus plantarum subsp. plantarum] [Lactiplantibacillus mudanjiangensis]|uniref:helix-turn-helix domain-containing protein n=1 Tax=Lactiplantibacillus mudanjiangensis TaxID=1296538 RepID=UPI0010146E86|nr:helix-turn-helix transcriptional regulator [Lactiplantibacillus mudanjiangensis]VDG31479.1 transcriptional regulator [Lactobacillus plantarum subsp. plantarum] [Lactiplantibacillus mudanjiangensis]
MSFGSELKKLRLSKKMGVNQLALKSGVSSSQISRFENGKSGGPKPLTLQKLAKGLGVPDSTIFKIAGIETTSAEDTPKEIDLKETINNDKTIMTYEGRPIPPEDLEYILRILNGGKDDE